MPRASRAAILYALLFFGSTCREVMAEPAGDWPAWRGPGSAGSVPEGEYPSDWSTARNLAWKVELPGVGCSTPIVQGGRILLTSPVEGQDALLAFDLSGKEQWRTVVGRERPGKHRNASGSNPSPVTDGKRVFAYYKSGNLAGLELDGKLLWKTNLQDRFGDDTLWWDIGTSPVLTEKGLVVAVQQAGDSYLAAFDPAGGDLLWKVTRRYECALEGDQSYTTPIRIRHQGREALLVWGAEHLTAHDLSDGSLIWSCGGFNPERERNWVTVSSHVVAGDLVVVPYGRGSRLAAVRLGGEGDVTSTRRVWAVEDKGSFVPTPAVHDGRVYVLRDRGEVLCVDSSTGKTLWSGSLPKHRTSYYASPLVAGGKLYAVREDGVVFVVAIREGFELISENDMEERMIASPVPLDGRLLLRGERHLFCVAGP